MSMNFRQSGSIAAVKPKQSTVDTFNSVQGSNVDSSTWSASPSGSSRPLSPVLSCKQLPT